MKHSVDQLSEDIRSQIYKKAKVDAPSATSDPKHDTVYTTGEASRSFTSTSQSPPSRATASMKEKDDIEKRRDIYDQVKKSGKKGYVQIMTNRGKFNVQLHCDITPIASDNFLQLAQSGYYNGTRFHRLISNFMMQGGDPSGTGRGGQSAFNGDKGIPDEFDSRLSHESSGILSYANSGKQNDSKSQFFITFSPCTHLDNKHTVFGKVVGGLNELMRLNTTPTKGKDEPIDPIVIETVVVVENPFDLKKDETKKDSIPDDSIYVKAARSDPMARHPNRNSMQIGKYIDWDRIRMN
jgi:peptidyl-prolyl cis-trans isomerase-like protein 2